MCEVPERRPNPDPNHRILAPILTPISDPNLPHILTLTLALALAFALNIRLAFVVTLALAFALTGYYRSV